MDNNNSIEEYTKETEEYLEEVTKGMNEFHKERIPKDQLKELDNKNKKEAEEKLKMILMTQINFFLGCNYCRNMSAEELIIMNQKEWYDFAYNYSNPKKLQIESINDIDDKKMLEFAKCKSKNEKTAMITYGPKFFINNENVYNLLLSSVVTNYNFETLITNENYWYDYSNLIMHGIKAVETYLCDKLYKYGLLNKSEIKKIPLNKLIKKINDNRRNVFEKDVPVFLINYFFEYMGKYKDVYRNGYFHKDILHHDKVEYINEISYSLIILISVLFK